MHVIEDHGKIQFFDGKKELTLREGFRRLDELYIHETAEGRRIIDGLKKKYMKDLMKS